jgi:hypothetical protein
MRHFVALAAGHANLIGHERNSAIEFADRLNNHDRTLFATRPPINATVNFCTFYEQTGELKRKIDAGRARAHSLSAASRAELLIRCKKS